MTNPRPPAPADPWKDVDTLYGCPHCSCLHRKAALTFGGGLHCKNCDEVSDSPFEAHYKSAVDAARLATEQQHQQEIARLRSQIANREAELLGRQCPTCGGRLTPEPPGGASGVRCEECVGSEQAYLQQIKGLEQHTARLRAALDWLMKDSVVRAIVREAVEEGSWHAEQVAALAASPAPQET